MSIQSSEPVGIGIVGSRRRNTARDYMLVDKKFLEIMDKYMIERPVIVSGGCRMGADNFAERIARIRDIPLVVHKARWFKYGLKAGHIRNDKIARDSDILIACVHESRTGGTESTINFFKRYHGEEYLFLV